MSATYYNPADAMINDHPRMKPVIKEISDRMREAGFNYDLLDDIEPDLRRRLFAITEGGTIPVDQLAPESLAALKELQDYERKVAKLCWELESKVFDPVEEEIEKEFFSRRSK